MNTHEIRQKYLNFFKKQGHVVITSASLLPENDPTTLFTGSGMQPMIPFLLGEKHPSGTRICDSQKSFRAEDIEEIGDNRHTTFFEMLGNWSLGDYFREEQIPWMFTFLTQELGLDAHNLYISVFSGNAEIHVPKDEESVRLWQKQFSSVGIEAKPYDNAEKDGMRDGRIFYYNEKKNWWSRSGIPKNMPIGEPGGPDTEMFYDFGAEKKIHEQSPFKDRVCHINCDCGRFLEIGNNVFMAYQRTKTGFEPLQHKNVDFGGGLERIAAALSDDPDVFTIDVFTSARKMLEDLSGKKYGDNAHETTAFRVILDHLRAATFLTSDGASPSNKDQGYFTRRLMRRAIRFAKNLGIDTAFCRTIAESFIKEYALAYPDLEKQRGHILEQIFLEEEKFRKTLSLGLKQFEKIRSHGHVSGKDAFDLFTSYGFPYEITEELAQENSLKVDKAAFLNEMKKHQDLSRIGGQKRFSGGLADTSAESKRFHTATHLLHQALRIVLGTHVEQRGSNITKERLRFDFSHPDKLTPEQKMSVETLVNEQIQRDLPVVCEEMSVEMAKKSGAIGLFTEKYGKKVKVYSIGDFSKEICGGPHVSQTSELGYFKIKKEEACSSGTRRIKAVLVPKK